MDNARVEKLELITKRLMRRASKRTAAMITPYPISNAVFGDKVAGPVLRYMFPCDGIITKGFVRLGQKPKTSVMVAVKMFNDATSTTKGFALERKSISVEPNIPVKAGDCLEVSLVPDEEIVTEFWIAFLWKPTMADVEVKSFLIEELESGLLEG
ncbi:MAG: hypothetical protein KKD77_23010 [Gammaproteobacteria bacterium]|nr:hypothetical protein [Gammaproteobacteria bacterium]